jgi:hypothetical protein
VRVRVTLGHGVHKAQPPQHKGGLAAENLRVANLNLGGTVIPETDTPKQNSASAVLGVNEDLKEALVIASGQFELEHARSRGVDCVKIDIRMTFAKDSAV